jgi:hypothetical protein
MLPVCPLEHVALFQPACSAEDLPCLSSLRPADLLCCGGHVALSADSSRTSPRRMTSSSTPTSCRYRPYEITLGKRTNGTNKTPVCVCVLFLFVFVYLFFFIIIFFFVFYLYYFMHNMTELQTCPRRHTILYAQPDNWAYEVLVSQSRSVRPAQVQKPNWDGCCMHWFKLILK